MAKILGLDLGTNSIGWAVIEDGKKIIGTGVRIFPEGVDNLGEGENEQSKNSTRRVFRQVRRQIFRRKLRKKILLKELSKHNMCPLNEEQITRWYKAGDFPDTIEMREWLKENPYLLREKVLNEKISLNQLGRIFYQIAQHRGFLSNSRSAGANDKEEGAIYEGDEKTGKTGITKTQELIGEKTLGSYLSTIYPKESTEEKKQSYVDGLPRIRNRYTTRQMYINEFEKIWESQKKYHKELTDELKELFGGRKKDGYKKDGILFFQRPLRTQKFLVGKCTFEPKKTKCPASTISYELYRSHQFINTIECDGKKLNAEQGKTVLEILLTKDEPKFKEIRKKLKKPDGNFNYEDDDKCQGTWTISSLSNKKYFGSKWFEFSEKEQEDIWHVLYFFDDRDKLKEHAMKKWGFDEEKAIKISKFNLEDGYASLSKKAILNILPFLQIGFTYDMATTLGGIKNAFGNDWEKLSDKNKDFIITNVPEIVRSKIKGGYIEELKNFLRNEFGLKDEQLEKLYHHSSSISKSDVIAKLPVSKEADKEIANLRNPIVSTALFELRKLANAIINEYGKLDEIKIELSRDLKISKDKRQKIRQAQRDNERTNKNAIERLREQEQVITQDNILKYKLWEECQHTCPYTGKEISIKKLFSGEVQIEHILPWSRTLDDSYLNKTLCFAETNNEKGEQTPYEYFNKQGAEKWEDAKARALNLFYTTKDFPLRYEKFKRFAAEKFNDDFITRQLNDTRYISREAKSYLEKICDNVKVAPGQMTANLRDKWGLNSILNLEGDTKTRDDHRHHAVDALVMACFKANHLNEISKWNRYNRKYDLKDFPMPWEGFRTEAEKAVNSILVSYKQTNRVLTSRKYKVKKKVEKDGNHFTKKHINKGIAARGQLHDAHVYGLRKNKQGEESFHIREPLQSLTEAKIPKIVDEKIRTLVYKRLLERGLEIDPKNGKPIAKTKEQKDKFKQAFDKPIHLPNKNGDPVPIRKVRIKQNIGNSEQLKETNQYVNPKNNYAVLVYKKEDDTLNEEIITRWIATERKMQGDNIIKLPADGKEIIATLRINDMFLINLSDESFEDNKNNFSFLSNHLFRVQSISSMFYEFRHHLSAKADEKIPPYYHRIQSFGDGKTGWLTFNPIKVFISPSGKIYKHPVNAKTHSIL
ncbi:MAG: type II CRISPR RNA-guided endonuclease Cas9 [Bacteroidetes bacterium]|nr:type II CRISPR RNA-guided endonuclease Cas9 [Bacteroidota bacterium]